MGNLKITELAEVTSTSSDDVLPIVVNTSTTPLNKKIKVSNLPTGGGGGGNSKTVANNADTGLFTFPLAAGSYVSLFVSISAIAIKGTDWTTGINFGTLLIYNDGGTLHTKIDNAIGDYDSNSGSVSLSTFGGLLPLAATITTGIVTVTVNPGNVGTSPDSIVVDYILVNPKNVTITPL